MPKVKATKERTDILDSIKIKNLCVSKDILSRKEKDNPQNLEVINLVWVCYPGYIKNVYNSTVKTTQF